MPFPVTVGATTFTYSDFYPMGYLTAFPASVAAMGDYADRSITGTSATSLTIGTGSKSCTVTANTMLYVGASVRLTDTATPANFMDGTVTAYTPSSGALTFTSVTAKGSGTHASWNVILLSGVIGSAPYYALYPGASLLGTGAIDTVNNGLGVLRHNLLECWPCSATLVYTDFCETGDSTGLNPYPDALGGWYYNKSGSTAAGFYGTYSSDPSTSIGSARQGYHFIAVALGEKAAYTYGKKAFASVVGAGDFFFGATVRRGPTVGGSSSDGVFYAGLRGNSSSQYGDIFDAYGLGFEGQDTTSGVSWKAVFCNNGVKQEYDFGVLGGANSDVTLLIYGDKLSNLVFFKAVVDGSVFIMPYDGSLYSFSVSLDTWTTEIKGFVHPAFSVTGTTTGTSRLLIDRTLFFKALER